ncbi:MAG: ClC family H(+)/Cl(-) exchange transporter [Treponema sp.]|nr:ClC family H(+)/Cl(-) exchange transporter [Treponema sp.]
MKVSRIPLTVRRWYASRLAVILESILIGCLAGLIVVLFRYLLGLADMGRRRIYEALPGLPVSSLFMWIFCLAAAGLFLGWASMVKPMIRGSGIPQIKGALRRLMRLDWRTELPLKFITGILGLGAGLSLGREGPSIQIGAYTGRAVLSLLHRPHRERRILITSASAAGLAAAFNAPLAGVLFVVEELNTGFTPLSVACSMGAAVAADAVAGVFFGFAPIFDFRGVGVLPFNAFPWIALLGIMCGVLGIFFKQSLYRSQDLYAKLRIPLLFRPLVPLLVSIPLGFHLFDITGGGHGIIEALPDGGRTAGFVLLLLAGKLLFTALCYGSGTSGGIFLPLLACGALSGEFLALVLSGSGWIEAGQNTAFIILGMAAFFTAAVNAPVTGIILILEMSGGFNHLFSLVLVCLSAFVTTALAGSRPVYEVLLERVAAPAHGRP